MSHINLNDTYISTEPEIFKTYKNRVAFTGTVVVEGVTADETGRKIVPRGTFLDKDGKISSVSGGTGSDPVGLLDKTVDLTGLEDGDGLEIPLVVEGYLLGARLNVTDHEDYSAITTALPEIKIDPAADPEE